MTAPANVPSHTADVCVVIPCYNEGVAVFDVVRSYQMALPAARVVVFDNNSDDNTVAEARRAGAEVRQVPLQGKGNVVRRMFADVDADVYVMADGDGTYDASAAPRLVAELVLHRLDMVVGRRHSVENETYRSGHRFGNWALTTVVATLFGRTFQDMLSGYRVFSRRFAKSFPAQSAGFEIETELTIHALRLRLPVREVDTNYYARPEGSHSKLNTYRDGARILSMIVGLLRSERPLAFFGAIAMLAATVSVILAIPIWTTFLETGLVPRLPTAVLCASLAIIAVIAAVCGILLDAVTAGRLEARYASYLAQAQSWPTGADLALPVSGGAATCARRPAREPSPLQQSLAKIRARLFSPLSAYVWLPLITGIVVATVMRQDFNWDLQNYHLYNAYALLGARYRLDLGAAMFQSYFNPLLDVPHYWLSVVQNWNARWVAMLTGTMHGLAATSLLFIARRSLPASASLDGRALLVTVLGCLTCSYIMGVGTTIGDNSTAVLIMAALGLVVAEAGALSRRPARISRIALAGALAGLACGLKLTAGPYAVALMVTAALPAAPRWGSRAFRAVAFAAATVAGFAISGGWWHTFLWQEFGNPLFPQFNNLFGSPLAYAVGYGDPAAWQPRSLLEALAFPFVVVVNPTRVAEVGVRPLLWPVVYSVVLAGIALSLRHHRRDRGNAAHGVAPVALADADPDRSAAQRVVLCFAVVSYVVWMFAFGIFRYTVALEMVLPLVVWLLVARFRYAAGWLEGAKWLVVLASAIAVLHPALHERVDFAKKSYVIQPPLIAQPDKATVLLVGDVPLAWLLPAFPRQIAAIGLANNFPESQAYVDRTNQIIRDRGGSVLALIKASSPDAADVASARFRAGVDNKLQRYGRRLGSSPCAVYSARAGDRQMRYQLCEVLPR